MAAQELPELDSVKNNGKYLYYIYEKSTRPRSWEVNQFQSLSDSPVASLMTSMGAVRFSSSNLLDLS